MGAEARIAGERASPSTPTRSRCRRARRRRAPSPTRPRRGAARRRRARTRRRRASSRGRPARRARRRRPSSRRVARPRTPLRVRHGPARDRELRDVDGMARPLVVVGEPVGPAPSANGPAETTTQPARPPRPGGRLARRQQPAEGHRLAHRLGVLELVSQHELDQRAVARPALVEHVERARPDVVEVVGAPAVSSSGRSPRTARGVSNASYIAASSGCSSARPPWRWQSQRSS